MNRTLLFLILFIFFNFEVIGNQSNQLRKLAIKYVEVVSEVELANMVFLKINKSCKTQFENAPEFLLEMDFYLRQNTGYTFTEFVKYMDREKETDALGNELVKELMLQNGGCNTTALANFFEYVTRNNEENHSVFFRENETLFGLPKIIRTDKQIKEKFNLKLKEYKRLPYKELFDLSSALEHGSYRYSLFALSQRIKVDKEKSLELLQFAADKFKEPQAYYYAGKLLQSTSKVDAFQAFEISAKQGYKDGEIWLGTYYACNKDNLKARYWLEIAKKDYKDPDYIDDLYAEIDELGMPTNCIDGWIY
jgi:hypothetical protein